MKHVCALMLLAATLTGCSSIGGYPDFSGGIGYPSHEPAYPRYPAYPPPVQTHRGDASSEVVSCSSRDQRRAHCHVQVSQKDSVYLINRESRASCLQGRDWGVDRGTIWVDNGCRATFRIERYYWR